MQTKQYPFYLKATVILFGLILFVYTIFNLRDILVPIAISLVLAILLNPLYNLLLRLRINKVVAISLTLLVAFIVISGLFYFLSIQMARFGEAIPLLKQKYTMLQKELEVWLQQQFGLSVDKQMQLVDSGLQKGQEYLGSTVSSALGILGLILLLPVYIFLFLYYKTLILNFLYEVFAEENSKQVNEILKQTKSSIQSYMVGLLLEALIVAVLNSAALMILDIKYAILLGVIGAILNMLPYIGGIIAIALPVLMATVTKDGYQTQLGVIIAYSIIQFIDNNILVPQIVSSKVKINALISILAVLLGGAVWGVSGMFLSIPFVAILKIIFDRVEGLRPWGKLLGDEIPTRHKGQIWTRIRKRTTVSDKIVSDVEQS